MTARTRSGHRRVPSAGRFVALVLLVLASAAAWIGGGSAAASGAVFALARPDRCLALLGLGVALAPQRDRVQGAAGLALLAGLALAAAARWTPLWPTLLQGDVYPRLNLLGPLACLLSGLLLVMRGRGRSLLAAPVALFIGVAVSLAASLGAPPSNALAHLCGAALASLWLAALAAGLRSLLVRPWLAVGEPIAGSWLVTVGLLLAALQFVPARPDPAVDDVAPRTAAAPPRPAIPDFAPAVDPRSWTSRPAFVQPDEHRGTN